MIVTIPVFLKLGTEFMPPLEEGSIFFMPTTMPGISIGEAQKLLQNTDRIIKQFPEVERVLGKAGRAETSTDPAPLSMLETVIILRPKDQWRTFDTWYSSWDEAFASIIQCSECQLGACKIKSDNGEMTPRSRGGLFYGRSRRPNDSDVTECQCRSRCHG